MIRKTTIQLLSIFTLGCATTTWADEPASDDIQPQPLNEALRTFADQSGLQVVYRTALATGIVTNGTDSPETDNEALDQLLASTGLEYRFVNDRTVAIQVAAMEVDDSKPGKLQPASDLVLMAQNQTSVEQRQSNSNPTTSRNEEAPLEIEEIIVTGTNIRGVRNSALSVVTMTNEDIVIGGFSTVEAAIKSLPQNFGGGPNASNIARGRGDDATANVTGGSSVNLRGLGSDSTLVLINGHRVAPTLGGAFVDLSVLPLGAVDRIDILLDGASAIYGSDAVGGVVNVILKQDQDVNTTHLRYGNVTNGDAASVVAGHTFGKSWNDSNLMAGYEFYSQNSLSAADRDVIDEGIFFTLLPETERHSAFLTTRYEISDNSSILADLIFANRQYETQTAAAIDGQRRKGDVTFLSASVGADIDLSDRWSLNLVGLYGLNNDDADASVPVSNLEFTVTNDYDIWSGAASLNGQLFELGGGSIRLALGSEYREEQVELGSSITAGSSSDRGLYSAYGEIFVPLVSSANSLPLVEKLEVTGAFRYEDYSDFGSATSPNFSILWSPFADFNIRGTFGESFRAPRLSEIGDNFTAVVLNAPDPTSPSGTSPAIVSFGDSLDLAPEEAETLTVGFDWRPVTVSGFQLSVTYFDTKFTDRIAGLVGLELLTALTNEEFLSSRITRNPTLQELDPFFNASTFVNTIGVMPAEIEVLIDGRLRNISVRSVSGLDFQAEYNWDVQNGSLTVGIDGTYLDSLNERQSATAPEAELVGTVFRPTDLKLRGRTSYIRDRLSLSAFVNYTGGIENTVVDPTEKIDSFVTVDARVAYEFDSEASLLNGMEVALSIDNLFDEDPPFADIPEGFNFDPTNASAVGRLISLQVVKNW